MTTDPGPTVTSLWDLPLWSSLLGPRQEEGPFLAWIQGSGRPGRCQADLASGSRQGPRGRAACWLCRVFRPPALPELPPAGLEPGSSSRGSSGPRALCQAGPVHTPGDRAWRLAGASRWRPTFVGGGGGQ